MDIYGTTVTAVTQVILVTIFIKGIISDIKSYEDDRTSIQLRLDLQLTSLEFFRRRFLDKQHGLLLPGQLPDWVAETICNLLLKMSRVLAEYRVLVREYDILDLNPEPEEDDDVERREKWKQSFLDRAKTKVKMLKSKGYDWALFDKKKLLKVLEEYKEWTDSLRDLMQHFSQETLYALTDNATSSSSTTSLKGTGLELVVKRQQLASAKAPADFGEIGGDIVEDESPPSSRFQLGYWKYQGGSTTVVLEYRGYDRRLRYGDLDPDEIEELKAPVRNLAWLLQNSTFTEGDEDPGQSVQPTIYSLQCLGYKDQVEKERAVFVYKLPSAVPATGDAANAGKSLTTLHELINQVDSQTKRPLKPSLGDRFGIAHRLALTVLNVHGSLWVHKNIWSKGILLFQRSSAGTIGPFLAQEMVAAAPTKGGEKTTRLFAFLGDWGYARPVKDATEMRSDFEIEPNLYRHPDRQGAPTRQFSRSHDIYALGVVLLEIGLWKTISRLFDSRIKEGQRTGKLPKPRDVRSALVSLAQRDLSKEMGDTYASAVVACLTGDLRKNSDMELSLDFREKVVDTVAMGMTL
jgi:hypothetical protein